MRPAIPGILLCLVAAQAAAEPPPLVPREVLFAGPARTQARLAPDAKHVSFVAPSADGRSDLWLRELETERETRLTRDAGSGVRLQRWAEDGRHLLYTRDAAGDGSWRLYAADVIDGGVRDLTPYAGVRAQSVWTDRLRPREILVALNRRDPRIFDVHRIDLATGAESLDVKNPGDVVGWLPDAELRARAAVAVDPRSGSRTLRLRDAKDRWRDTLVWPFEEEGGVVGFAADGTTLVVESSLGTDTTRLVILDAATGEERGTLAQDARSDVGQVMLHPQTRAVQAVSFEYERPEWAVLDPSIRADMDALRALRRGRIFVTSRDRADRLWLVAYEVDDGPASYVLWNRETRSGERLFVNRPVLDDVRLARREPYVITARDGLELVAYLTRPPDAAKGPLPLVLLVHGGPWARDHWGWDARAQWLANRGYAVLQVNFRGSAGFGKRFLERGDGEWGRGAMQHDLADAVRWAVSEGIADPKRVCIQGSSYGGYAALAGLAFTPELYACGVDWMGPSNLKTLVSSVPEQFTPMRARLARRVGDVTRDEALNRRLSPLFHADAIRAPLFVAQAAGDPRVSAGETEQLVAALRKAGREVEYVAYGDEALARPEHRLDFYARVEAFLARHLGGRVEPAAADGDAR
jgi:dipeptidyl aminopeptidase/acylaminoacyl peptidase